MELARLSSKGQITIPKEIREKLHLKQGDKVLFFEEGEKVVVANASRVALKEMQKSMKSVSKEAGISENEVLRLSKEARKELLKS